MVDDERERKIQLLEALRTETSALTESGYQSSEFQNWYAKTVEILRCLFGDDNRYLREILALHFETPPKLADAIKQLERNTRIISSGEGNVTRVETMEQALERGRKIMSELGITRTNIAFDNVIHEADSILLNAILDLRGSKAK